MAHITQINTPTSRKSKQEPPRMIPMTQLGWACPASTPEGSNCPRTDQLVVLPDGSLKAIGNLKDGDEILTIDPQTLKESVTAITKHFVKSSAEYGRPVLKVTSVNGDSIIATDDHPFLTQRGWINLKDLDINSDRVAIYSDRKVTFVPIASITPEEPCDVADFTTVSDTHTMIASNFVVHNCGLIKSKTVTCRITSSHDELKTRPHLTPLSVEMTDTFSVACIFNGKFMGWCNGPSLRDQLVHFRRTQRIPMDTTILLENEYGRNTFLNIYTDASRPVRPLLVVEGNQLVIEKKNLTIKPGQRAKSTTFDIWLVEGAVEFIEPWEQEEADLAQSIDDLRRRQVDLAAAQSIRNEIIQRIERLRNLTPAMFRVTYPEITYSEYTKLLESGEENPFEFTEPEKVSTGGLTNNQIQRYINRSINLENLNLSNTEKKVEDLTKRSILTHCEMDPSALFGIAASIIPYPEQIASARSTYQVAMGKQALGIYHSNNQWRLDTTTKMLAWPTRPLFETQMYREIGFNVLPAGQMVIVAMMTYEGFNQEDSLVFKKSSIERGLFMSVVHRRYRAVLQKIEGNTERFGPPEVRSRQTTEKVKDIYRHLDERGVAKIGSLLVPGDVVINKLEINQATGNVKNAPTTISRGEGGTVEAVLFTLNESGQSVVKVKVRQVRMPVVGDKFACFRDDHDVLTSTRGWIKISTLTTDDKVAILSPDGNLVYENPSAVHEYDYEGRMYNLVSQQVELCATPTHRMYIKKRGKENFELDTAENIFGKRVNYKKNANWVREDMTKFTLPSYTRIVRGKEEVEPDFTVKLDDWITFFGIWIAEGYASEALVSFSAHKPRVKEALTNACEGMGIPISKNLDRKTGTMDVWNVRVRTITDYLHPLSVGSTNKSLPEWCFNLSQRQSRLLLEALMLGDGHKHQSGCYHYYTSSTRLADDVSRLALHAGWSGNINQRFEVGHSVWLERDQTFITTTAPAYVVTIVRMKNEPQVNHGHVNTQNGQSEEWIPFKGKVYCCTVSSGVFYVRHNGKPVWTGNSRYSQKGTIGRIVPDEDMPFTAQGVKPDLIFNPHGLPSRMTISKLVEIIASKYAVMTGERINATAYNRVTNIPEIQRNLREYGYNPHGWERLYSGFTGKPIQAQIFIGPCYYQALKHMVEDKYQARAKGAIKPVTRQPVGGRSKNNGGALRSTRASVGVNSIG